MSSETAQPTPAGPRPDLNAPLRRRPSTKALAVAVPFLLPLVGVVVWQVIAVASGLPQLVLPRPRTVGAQLIDDWAGYLRDTEGTLLVALAGTCLGTGVGYPAALAAASSTVLSGLLSPAAVILRTTPLVALIPLIARVVGYGRYTALATTALVAFFPTFVLTGSAIGANAWRFGPLCDVLGVRTWRRVRRLVLPYSLPGLVSGVRLAAAAMTPAALTAEYLTGGGGLGGRLVTDQAFLSTARVWATLVVATVVSVTAYLLLALLDRWVSDRVQEP